MLTIVVLHLVQVTVLIILVAGLVRLTSRNRPHLAHALWLVVLLKCVLPPVWSSPGSVWNWLPVPALMKGDAPTNQVHSPSVDVRYFAARVSETAEWQPEQPDDATAMTWTARSGIGGRGLQMFLARALLIVWGIGACCILIVTSIRLQRCRQQINRGLQQPPEDLVRMMSGLRRRLGVRKDVRLLTTDAAIGPAVMGWFRPALVLPTAVVSGKSYDELEPIIAHELIHIRRGDLWTGLLQAFAGALWWFHPLVAYAGWCLSRETERCCDEQVIAELCCKPTTYARSLLDVLERKRELSAVPVVPGLRPIDVTRDRMERIMKLGQGSRKRTPASCWLVMGLLGFLALPGGADDTRTDKVAQADNDIETRTDASGRLLFGVGVNSDASVTGVVQVDPDGKRDAARRMDGSPASDGPTNKSDAEERLVTVVYPVGDLVAPLPGRKPRHPDGESGEVAENGAKLMAQLTRTVAPDSWGTESGVARLAFDEKKRSLVVSQTTSAHDAVARYLTSLRDLQCQVTIRSRLVSVPKEEAAKLLDRAEKRRVLEARDVMEVTEQLQRSSRLSDLSLSAMTLMNGQAGMLSAAPLGDHPYVVLTMMANVAEDRRTIDVAVAVTAAPRANDPLETLLRSRRATVSDGGAVIWDVTDSLALALPVNQRLLLVLTPKIIVQEEKEELLRR